MKTLMYIWRNATRNKLRSSLTVLSVGFSLALMTVLYGYLAMQSMWGEKAEKSSRIVVMNIQGFSGAVPIATVDKVRDIDGVKGAVPYSWFGGNYRDDKMPFAQFATDPDDVFNVWDEYKIDPQQLEAWQNDRQGCVADRELVERRGWKIGERIPIEGTIYPVNLDLKLVGVFDPPTYTDSLWFHWKYLDESLQQKKSYGTGNAGMIFARVESPSDTTRVIDQIDKHYASSQTPTRTQTEAAFAQMFVDMMGNVRIFIRNIAIAVAFSLSLVAGNAMAMSMRERTTEVAVLKAIGFPRQRVLWMILGESCLIALFGGVLGTAMGCLFLQGLHSMSAQMFPVSIADLAGPWLLWLLLAAVGIGFVSGIVPAVRAAQLSVIDGLRRIV